MRRTGILLIGCSVLFLALDAVAAAAAEPEATAVLHFIRGIPFLSVTIGKAKAELMLDTGGQLGITLDKALAKRAGTVSFLDEKSKHSDAAGNVVEIQNLLAQQVSIGKLKLDSVSGTENYKWGLSVGDGKPADLNAAQKAGAIGLGALAPRPLLIDYRHKKLMFYKAGDTPNLSEAGWISLAMDYGKLGPLVNLQVNGQTLKMVLDTGASASIVSPPSLDPAKFVDVCKDKKEGSNYCGHKDFADVKTDGGVSLGTLPVELVEIQGPPFDGLLGAYFFDAHLVFMDFANHRVWVKSNH